MSPNDQEVNLRLNRKKKRKKKRRNISYINNSRLLLEVPLNINVFTSRSFITSFRREGIRSKFHGYMKPKF